MREAVATGVVRAGKLALDDKDGFAADVGKLKDGAIVLRAELVTPKALRSIKANKYYRFVLDMMAEDTEQDEDSIHDDMCARFLKHQVRYVDKTTGEVDEHEVAGRSSKLEPEEFWTFVDNVRDFARDFLGLIVPDPDPEWRINRPRGAA